MDNKMAAILLASLLERIHRDGGTGTVSSHETQALRCALLALDPDAAATVIAVAPPAPTLPSGSATVQPEVAVTPPPVAVAPIALELPEVSLVLDSLKLKAPTDDDVLLCLDFGTAMSKAFASVFPDEYLDLELGTAAGRSGYTLPSSVFISDDGKAYFGHEAIERSQGLTNSGRQRLDSIKAWLSQQNEGSLDGEARVLSKAWNPTDYKLTQGDLIRVYLAYLTDMANHALSLHKVDNKNVGRYVRRRFARPCWPNPAQAKWADNLMRVMLAEAQVLADTFSNRWGGVSRWPNLKLPLRRFVRCLNVPIT